MVIRFGGISVRIECLGEALAPRVAPTMVPEAACEVSLAVLNNDECPHHSKRKEGRWNVNVPVPLWCLERRGFGVEPPSAMRM